MELSMMNLKSTESAKVNSRLPYFLIWGLVLVWMLLVWPGNMVREDASSRSIADDDRKTDHITQDLPVIQEFYPKYDRLYSVGFVLNREEGAVSEGTVSFKLYDEQIHLLAQQDFLMEEIADGSLTEVILNQKVKAGELYYFRIEVSGLLDKAPTLSYRSLSGCGPEENGQLYFGSNVIEDGSAVCRYEYRKKVGLAQVLAYDSFGVLMGMVLTEMVRQWKKKKELEVEMEKKSYGKK